MARKRKSIEFRTLQRLCSYNNIFYGKPCKILIIGTYDPALTITDEVPTYCFKRHNGWPAVRCSAQNCPIWNRLPDVEPVRVTVQSRKGETVFVV